MKETKTHNDNLTFETMTHSKTTTLGQLEEIGYDWNGDTQYIPEVYDNPEVWETTFGPETEVTVHRNGAVYYSGVNNSEITLAYDSVAISDEDWERI